MLFCRGAFSDKNRVGKPAGKILKPILTVVVESAVSPENLPLVFSAVTVVLSVVNVCRSDTRYVIRCGKDGGRIGFVMMFLIMILIVVIIVPRMIAVMIVICVFFVIMMWSRSPDSSRLNVCCEFESDARRYTYSFHPTGRR